MAAKSKPASPAKSSTSSPAPSRALIDQVTAEAKRQIAEAYALPPGVSAAPNFAGFAAKIQKLLPKLVPLGIQIFSAAKDGNVSPMDVVGIANEVVKLIQGLKVSADFGVGGPNAPAPAA